MTISVQHITKEFDDYKVLDDINFIVNNGELVALLGPSGSGKTTLLRIIAGLEIADKGDIFLGDLNTKNIPVKNRGIGFVFQHYALFNHMTIYDNIAFGLRVKNKQNRLTESQIKERVNFLLKLVHIERLSNFYPKQISGGQKQRVALARALAIEPKILLLDEPFGALDSKVRKELRKWIRQLHKEINLTSIFVTHDQEEAMEIADRIIVMNQGKIEQMGTPQEVYHNPKNSFIFDFLGNFNLFEEKLNQDSVIAEHSRESTLSKKQPDRFNKDFSLTKLFPLFKKKNISGNINNQTSEALIDRNIQIFSRPYNMEVLRAPVNEKYIKVKLVHINPAGPVVKLELEKNDGDLIYAEISHKYYNKFNPQIGENLYTYPRESISFSEEN